MPTIAVNLFYCTKIYLVQFPPFKAFPMRFERSERLVPPLVIGVLFIIYTLIRDLVVWLQS